jgi:hypothetical protein
MQPTIHDAVRIVYSNAITISGNEVNSLSVVDANNTPVEIDPDIVLAQLISLQNNYTSNKQTIVNKLSSIGLTSSEISILIG